MDILLSSRINSPNLPSQLVKRDRLLNILEENKKKKLMLICSPAGYGKTTLVLEHLRANRINYAWISLSENTNHIYTFYDLIIKALKKVKNDFGKNTMELLDSLLEKEKLNQNLKNSIIHITNTFREEFDEHFDEFTALVLDDFHHLVNAPWKDFAADTLLKNCPKNLQLIITTRQIPDIDIASYIVDKAMVKLEMDDLVFNEVEIAGLLSSKYHFTASPEKIKEIRDKLKGWITGLHVLIKNYGDNLDELEIDDQPIPENIFNELAEKLYNDLDENSRKLLAITSIVDNFHSELCRTALGLEDFDNTIKKLADNLAFIFTIPINMTDGKTVDSYNYVQLFRNFLRTKFYDNYSEDVISNIYRRISRYYERKSDLPSALNYMISSGDHEAALKKINMNFDSLLEAYNAEYLWNWMNAIKPELIENDTESLVNYGVVKRFFTGELKSTLKTFEKAVNSLRPDTELNILKRAFSTLALLKIGLGKASEIITQFREIIDKNEYPAIKPLLLYYKSYACFHTSDYLTSERLLLDALHQLKDHNSDEKTEYNIYKLLGHINLIKGNYKNALENYDKTVSRSKNVFDKYEILCNLTLLSSQSGEYEKAKEYLAELEDMLKKFKSQVLLTGYQMAKQAYLFESGQYDEALQIMKEIKQKAESLENIKTLYLSERLITECYYYKGETDLAKEYFEISKRHIDKNNYLKNIELNVSDALLSEKMRNDEKLKIFSDAHRYFSEHSLQYNLSQSCYYIAQNYFAKKDIEAAIKYLRQCEDICINNGYKSFLIREYIRNSDLLNNYNDSGFINEIKKRAASLK